MLLVALGSGAGIWAAFHLPSAIYPQLDFQRVVIVAQGTALGAEQQVFSVTRPLEAAASVVPAVERVRSRTIRGATEISVNFSPGTDMVEALQLVRAQVNQIRSELPPELELEIQRMQPSLFPILTYSLVGGDPADLYDLARYEIKPVILRIPDVGRVDIQSGAVREMEVIADPSRLATVGLSYGDLAEAIREAIGVDAVGRVNRDYEQYLVVTDQTAHSAEDVGNVVVRGGLRVRDIARVELGTEDRVRLIVSGGQPASLINISLQRDGNTVAVADSVARTMNTVQASLPPGTRLDAVYDQASLVREAVSSVRDAMLVGALLVVIVLGLFLRESRITAIAAASIPLTMAITILGLRLLGQTFNLMSLGGMAIAIGLVIDDTVVVTENIARHLELGHARRDAIRDAVAELLWPVTTSTLTTVVVFLPLGLLQGVVGQFFAALSIALASAVLVSLVLALTLVPLLCDRFLSGDVASGLTPGGATAADAPTASRGNSARRGRPRWRQASAGIGRALERLSSSYERSLTAALLHPGRVGILALGLVAAGVLSAGFVGTGFLPTMDEEAFVLDYFTPGGTALEETDRELGIVEDILADVPEIIGDARRTGSEMGLFATGQNTGDFAVRLSPRRRRSRDVFAVIDEVRERIQTALPRMRVEFVQVLTDVINDLAGNPAPVEIKLFGDRLEALEMYARRLAPSLEAIDGLVDLYDGVSQLTPETLVKVDGAAAGRIGLSPAEVTSQVSAALLGTMAGEVRSEERAIGVRVRAPDALRYDARRLGELPVFVPGRSVPTPLSALARLRDRRSREELSRENQQQMIAITAEVESRSLGEVIRDVKRVLADHPPPSGLRIELGGQYAGQRQAFQALVIVLGLAVLSVIAVMLIEFRSFLEPCVIVLVAPLSFVGATTLLLVTGTPLNVSSFMGMILLVGLIVKNGIILLDFTYHRMETLGEPLGEALPIAARTRLRPILMTTLATLFGLLPLALGVGAGSQLQRPLALTVIGGLALSTPITLYVVPTLLTTIRGRSFSVPTEFRAAS